MKKLRIPKLLLTCCLLAAIASCSDDDVLVLQSNRHAGSGQHQTPPSPDKPAEVIEWGYPFAEWAMAGSVLMHTPGEELFEGVIHPSAGLFEHYFDVDKAAQEHQNYIKMLQNNGIEVFTVMDILNEVKIEKLRALVEGVLVYDISDIQDESAEASEEYRRDIIQQISDDGRLEGGDYIPAGTVSFIGMGMRTNPEGIRQMLDADAFGHDTVVVVKDHKYWQMQMHLDTHFNIIDKDLCTMVTSRLTAQPGDPEYDTCDIYARAPGTKPYALVSQDVPFVDYLKIKGFDIIPIDYDDEMHYANNFLTIAPRHIMAVAGQSEVLQQRFQEAKVTVEWIPLESLIDGYGAAHCMTQVMTREMKNEDFLEQRVQIQACLEYAESRQNCYEVKLKINLSFAND